MNRTYELMFIVRPDMVEEDLNKLISTLESRSLPARHRKEARSLGQAPSRLHGWKVQ